MHTKPMKDSEGTFNKAKPADVRCRSCGMTGQVTVQEWESSCGGYEDYRYKCTCGHVWWIEGPDA